MILFSLFLDSSTEDAAAAINPTEISCGATRAVHALANSYDNLFTSGHVLGLFPYFITLGVSVLGDDGRAAQRYDSHRLIGRKGPVGPELFTIGFTIVMPIQRIYMYGCDSRPRLPDSPCVKAP
jgi:hypothetical protein